MKLKIKKLDQKAVLPKVQTEGSAGMDLTAISCKVENRTTGPVVVYGTGLALEIPKGYVGLIFPRSSIATHTSLDLSNAVGVIDSDYRGEITFVFRNTSPTFGKKYNEGDRVGQLLIIKLEDVIIEETNELSDTKRGTGGYGSTGK